MNKNSILFIGIGQAGNNLVSEILSTDKRYNGLFINTSYDDLKLIKNANNTYIVPSAGGTGKNRDLAKSYVKDYIYSIVDKINEFPMQNMIYIAFSMGGGTGSGISPTLINVLEKVRPDLTINIIPILPFATDSKKSFENTIECWNEIIKLKNVNTIYLIDNNKRASKSMINKEFSSLFNSFMNSTEPNPNGVIDISEIEILSSAKGLSGIFRIDNDSLVNLDNIEDDNDEDDDIHPLDLPKRLAKEIKNSIFSGINTTCQYLGLSLTDEDDIEPLLESFNIGVDHFVGFNKENPLIIVSGVELNNRPLKRIDKTLKDKNSQLDKIDKDISPKSLELELDSKSKKRSMKNKIKPTKIEVKDIDKVITDDFWNDILNR